MKDKVVSALTAAAGILIAGAIVFIVLSLLGVVVGALLVIIPIALVVLAVVAAVCVLRGKSVDVEWSFGNNLPGDDDDSDDVIKIEDYKEVD